MRRLSGTFALCSTFLATVLACPVRAQTSIPTYLNATGSPNFSVNIPVPNGFINIANGNLHMEIPLATHKQRGALSLNERLVYDSRIWKIISYSHHYWWPLNIPNAQAGWRFVKGNETGTLNTVLASTTTNPCSPGGGGPIEVGPTDPSGSSSENDQSTITWTDPSGTTHVFDGTLNYSLACDGTTSNSIIPGYALDGTGYQVKDDGTGNPLIVDPSGNEMYPQVADRFGNFWSSDTSSSANLVDDLGRTPVIVTQNGSQTYYDVLAPSGQIQNNGTRVRYIVTTTQVTLNTEFQQQGVTEYQGNNAQPLTETAIQSIQLPDGSQYQFGYDSYAQITVVTLPTGGIVQYNWTNYQDSYQNVNRWVSSVVTSDGTTSFTPQVLNQCSSGGAGCQEQVTMQRASGDQTVYTMTLNNGAWDTATTVYSGAASANTPLTSGSTSYNFANSCSNATVCSVYPGAQYVTKSLEKTTLTDTNQSTQIETDYTDPHTGQMTGLSQWDYFTGSPSSTATRSSTYKYTGFDLTSQTHYDASGNIASATVYNYTGTATPTSGVVGHGTLNAGGPYLTSVVKSDDDPAATFTAQSQYDDTGALTATQDYNGNPFTKFKYDPTHTFVTEIDKPDTQTAGVTYHHVTKTSYDMNSGAIVSSDDENSVANGQAYTVKYAYEPLAGRPQSVTYPIGGGSTAYAYPTANEVDKTVAQSASVSITTSYLADGYGRPSTTTSAGISTEQTYDVNGRGYSTTNPHVPGTSSSTDGLAYTFYDPLNRPSSVQHVPSGTIMSASYTGNVVTTTDELGNQSKRTYNAFGDLTNVLEPDPATGALDLETDYWIDSFDNIICVEQHGNVSGTGCGSPFTSDATSPWRVRRFSYDLLSRLRAASIPEHMSLPNFPGSQNCGTPDGASTWTDCYYYDPNGNRTQHTDNQGLTATFRYDALNRPTSESTPNSKSQVINNYAYDAGANGVGLLFSQSTGATGSNSASFYNYDALGRVVNQSSCIVGTCGSGQSGGFYSVGAGYDYTGNLISITYPDGRVIQNNFDNLNRLSSVQYQQWGGQAVGTPYWTASSYAPPGELMAAQYGNSVNLQAAFDPRQSIVSLSYQVAQTQLFNKSYVWASNATNLLSETNLLNSQKRQFGYDTLNRLRSAQDFSGGTPGTGSATLTGAEKITSTCTPTCTSTYDTGSVTLTVNGYSASTAYRRGSTPASLATALNSLLNASSSPVKTTVSGATISMTSKAVGGGVNYNVSATSSVTSGNAPDFNVSLSSSSLTGGQSQPLQSGLNQQYALDAWGNLTSMGTSGFNQPVNKQNQVAMFTYDAVGRLISDGSYQYAYDDNGMLLSSSDGVNYGYDAAGQRILTGSGAAIKASLYFSGVVLATIDGTGAWTDMIYAGSQKIATVAGTQVALPVYGLRDHLGSEVATTDNSGNLITAADYSPFGQLLSGSLGDPYFFTGLERDNTSLDHAQVRQYSSTTGRWTVPDPYDGSYDPSTPQSLNRYAYVSNMPLWLVDPSGQSQVPCPPGSNSAFCFTTITTGGSVDTSGSGFGLLLDVVTIGLDFLFSHGPPFLGNPRAQSQGKKVRNDPCAFRGAAKTPSQYAAAGQAWNNTYGANAGGDGNNQGGLLAGGMVSAYSDFHKGGALDAQPYATGTGLQKATYGNYVYGVFFAAAGFSLDQALSAASFYGYKQQIINGAYLGRSFGPYGGIPIENAQDITAGYNAQNSGTTCHQ